MQHVNDVRQHVWEKLWYMACESRNGTVPKFEENAVVLGLQYEEMTAFYGDVLDLPVASGYYKSYLPAGLSGLNEHIVKVVVMLEELRILYTAAVKGRYDGDEDKIKAIRAFGTGVLDCLQPCGKQMTRLEMPEEVMERYCEWWASHLIDVDLYAKEPSPSPAAPYTTFPLIQ